MKRIKHIKFIIPLVIALFFSSNNANAQFWEIANQIPSLIEPALSGRANYKGYAEVSYLKGLGSDRVDFLDISTTQGFKINSWFFFGVGAGVDVMFPSFESRYHYKQDAGIMVPLYSDFRFFIGKMDKISVNIDLRLGVSFNMNDEFQTNNGEIVGDECFYLKPSLAVRIPVSKKNPKLAVNVGVSYQLTTADWIGNYYDEDKAFNNIGATLSFEW